jgi:hypothetical protein
LRIDVFDKSRSKRDNTYVCEICQKEEELAFKTLRLMGGSSDLDYSGKLLYTTSKKPTIRVKRLSFNGHHPNSIKLKGTTSIRKEIEKLKKLYY